jgi:hypothetical protein
MPCPDEVPPSSDEIAFERHIGASRSDGAYIQSDYGKTGDFESLVIRGGLPIHYRRENDAPGRPWLRRADLPLPGSASTATRASKQVDLNGISFFQSTLHTGGSLHGAFQAIGRVHDLVGGSDYLIWYSWDAKREVWRKPQTILVDDKPIAGVVGTPAMIQSDFGPIGNFELVVPHQDRLTHYWCDTGGGGVWHKGPDLPLPIAATTATDSTGGYSATSVCLFLEQPDPLDRRSSRHHGGGRGHLVGPVW